MSTRRSHRRRARAVWRAACAGSVLLAAGAAYGDELEHPVAPGGGNSKEVRVPTAAREKRPELAETEGPLDYDSPRSELAAFPLLGGDSDIGFEFGAVATLTRFSWSHRPYAWNMDLLLAASVKSGPNGAEITQQNYLWQLDVPHLNGTSVRLNPTVSYERTVNHGYFGLGNASSSVHP